MLGKFEIIQSGILSKIGFFLNVNNNLKDFIYSSIIIFVYFLNLFLFRLSI